MVIFKINNVDFSDLISGLKVGYETLVSDSSGRNAAGDTVIDIINTKRKVYVTTRHMWADEMKGFLSEVRKFTVKVQYLDPVTGNIETADTYTGTPEPEYYNAKLGIYKPLSINFIEL